MRSATRIERECQPILGGLKRKDVRVEMWAEGRSGEPAARLEMAPVDAISDPAATYVYTALIPADRAPGDFTSRIIPHHPDAMVPLEANEIIWFK
jgi:starch phosphorylase